MPSVQTICDVYVIDIQDGKHQPGDDYRLALFTDAATNLDANLTTYTGLLNEVVGAGYTAGGKALTGRVLQLFGRKGCLDFDDLTWPAATITARYAVCYNNTLAAKRVLFVLDFGANKTSTNGNFTVNLPAPGAATSLVRIPAG